MNPSGGTLGELIGGIGSGLGNNLQEAKLGMQVLVISSVATAGLSLTAVIISAIQLSRTKSRR